MTSFHRTNRFRFRISSLLWLTSALALGIALAGEAAPAVEPVDTEAAEPGNDQWGPFDRERLVAWCVVPFDARQRGPVERAEMIQRLGIQRVAYDWREQHVPTFEAEIRQYKQRGIEFFAFWSWHDAIEPLIDKYQIQPQIWTIFPSPEDTHGDGRVAQSANAMLALVEKTRRLGLKLGIYNHGGWSGEPANMVAICRHLRDHHDAEHVGIVYNFHHGHEHIDRFAASLEAMKPYLLCVNINGMVKAEALREDPDKKILPVGAGTEEEAMLRTLLDSGYRGPVGILGHRSDQDVEVVLRKNLAGLAAFR